MTPETLSIELSDRRIATVWLNRPDRGNAFNQAMLNELAAQFAAFAADDGVRVVVLRGRGRHFCTGADLAARATEAPAEAVAPLDFVARERLQRFAHEVVVGDLHDRVGILLDVATIRSRAVALEEERHSKDRAFYLEAWNGDGKFSYDRIGRGTLKIIALRLRVLAAFSRQNLPIICAAPSNTETAMTV